MVSCVTSCLFKCTCTGLVGVPKKCCDNRMVGHESKKYGVCVRSTCGGPVAQLLARRTADREAESSNPANDSEKCHWVVERPGPSPCKFHQLHGNETSSCSVSPYAHSCGHGRHFLSFLSGRVMERRSGRHAFFLQLDHPCLPLQLGSQFTLSRDRHDFSFVSTI